MESKDLLKVTTIKKRMLDQLRYMDPEEVPDAKLVGWLHNGVWLAKGRSGQLQVIRPMDIHRRFDLESLREQLKSLGSTVTLSVLMRAKVQELEGQYPQIFID